MSELSPMIVVLLVPMFLFVLGVGWTALGTALGYWRERERFDAPPPAFTIARTPEISYHRTVAPRGRYVLCSLPGGRTHGLPLIGPVRVGSRPSAGGETLVIEAPTVSGDHAEITADGDAVRVANLSQFGTWVNDLHLLGSHEAPFGPGDVLRFGDELFRCEERPPWERAPDRDPGPPDPGGPEPQRPEGGRDDGGDDDGIKVHWVR